MPVASSPARQHPVPALRLLGVSKSFGDIRAVDGVDLSVEPGEFVAVLGPSGCGKTTMLRLVAGFEQPDAGGIEIAGRVVSGPRRQVPPERRRVGMVFQESALFPHLDVEGNIGFGLGRERRQPRVAELVALVGLAGLQRRLPHELSGGQQQRVALARALAPEPDLILLDEPFSGLDATLRTQLRSEVREILRAAGATALFVTHDQAEALEIADRVAVMRGGAFEQVAVPSDLYLRPANRFVAGFVGEANLLAGVVRDGHVETILGSFRAPAGSLGEGDRAEVLLRPEQLNVIEAGRARGPAAPVWRVVRQTFHGAEIHHLLRGPQGQEVEAATPSTSALRLGSRVVVHPRARQVPVYPSAGAARAPIEP